MTTGAPSRRSTAGFSLLELLVVLGIVATLLAAALSGFGADHHGPALRSAEAELAGFLTFARTHAVRTNAAARVLVALPQGDGQERAVLLLLDQHPSTGEWRACAPAHELPRGVRVVPDSGLPAVEGHWPAGLRSTFNGEMLSAAAGPVYRRYGYVHFSPNGSTFGSPQLVLASVRPTSTGWVLEAPQRARRFLIRSTGSFLVRAGGE